MGASSVTGVGEGMSEGEYKPELHCGGCGCGSKEEEEPTPVVKRGCVTRYVTGGVASYQTGSSTSIRVC